MILHQWKCENDAGSGGGVLWRAWRKVGLGLSVFFNELQMFVVESVAGVRERVEVAVSAGIWTC